MYRSVVWIDWSSSKCVFTYIFSRLFFFLCLWNKWLRSIGLVIGPTLSSFLHSSGFLGRQNSDRLVHHRTHLVFLHPFISSSDRPAQTSIDIECLFSFIHQAPAASAPFSRLCSSSLDETRLHPSCKKATLRNPSYIYI